jgi:hypothetical protein
MDGLRSGPRIVFSAADTFWGTRYPEDPREQGGPRNWADLVRDDELALGADAQPS